MPKKRTKVKLPAATPKPKVRKIQPPVKPVKSTFKAPNATAAYALAYKQWRLSCDLLNE